MKKMEAEKILVFYNKKHLKLASAPLAARRDFTGVKC